MVVPGASNHRRPTIGAGAASQSAIGIAVFGGMLAATVIGVIVVPVLYVMLQYLREWLKSLGTGPKAAESP